MAQGACHAEEGQLPRVTVVGTGYLGLTQAVCLADLGHDVLAIDVDADKIAVAASGTARCCLDAARWREARHGLAGCMPKNSVSSGGRPPRPPKD